MRNVFGQDFHSRARQGFANVFAFALLGLALLFAPGLSTSSSAWAQEPGLTYDQEIENGHDLLRSRRYEDALKTFKRANDLKGKTCAECFYLMANAYMGLEAYKNAIQSSESTIQFATTNTDLQAQAHNLKGVALLRQADNKDLKKMQEAEAAFRQSLALKKDFPEAQYDLGYVLLQQNRDAEGVAELKKFLEIAENDGNADLARKMIENPRRAREPFAPDFSFTTAEGEYVSLEELQGKVVLLDFWGTWCPPCVASVPGLRDLNKKYSKEAGFVMISVSSDGDEEKWKTFVGKEKMVWPQFLDRDRRVQRAFGVRAFPTYILLDHEGVIRYRASGMSMQKEASLENAVGKQIKLLTKATAAN
ncbi:MAG TPA: redoxin family protein [Pyrinomonadaceae bacterium]|nr:redoxin family protein [Pyrinomonadaceae bacterium]